MQGQHGSPSSFFGLIYGRLVPPGHTQPSITCLVVNCRRMARLLEADCGPPLAGLCLAEGWGGESSQARAATT